MAETCLAAVRTSLFRERLRWIACPQTLNRGREVLPRLFVSSSAGRRSQSDSASFLPTHRFESVSQMTKNGTHHPPHLMLPLCQKWTAKFYCENRVRSLLSMVAIIFCEAISNFYFSFLLPDSLYQPKRILLVVRKNQNMYLDSLYPIT